MNTGIKVSLMSTFGAVTGLMLSFYFLPKIWWPVCLVIGGIVGYMSFEFKKVIAAIPRAWNEALDCLCSDSPSYLEWLSRYAKSCLMMGGLIFNASLFFVSICFSQTREGIRGTPIYVIEMLISLMVFYALVMGLIAIDCGQPMKDTWYEWGLPYPIVFWIWYVPKGLLLGLIWTCKRIPKAAKVSWQFAKTFVRIINSDLRLLCGICAMLGFLTGHAFGPHWYSVLCGGVTGALIAFLSFEILSIRVFRLVSRTQSLF